jgi:DNA-binding XRE family transcriptional regulator
MTGVAGEARRRCSPNRASKETHVTFKPKEVGMLILPDDAEERSVARLMERLRNGKGWKQREVAQVLGISRSGVSKWEGGGGGQHVLLIHVPRICRAYELTEIGFWGELMKERRREAREIQEFERRRLSF